EFPLTYTVGRSPQHRELREVVSDDLGQVGVRFNQRPLEHGAFSTVREEGTLNTHQWGLLYPLDAVFYRTVVRDSPYEFHELPDAFTTVDDDALQATDPAVQEELFLRVSEIIAEEAPLLLLHVPNDTTGSAPGSRASSHLVIGCSGSATGRWWSEPVQKHKSTHLTRPAYLET
ncbi:MAG TPA: hypothetical protein VK356_06525, partial [Thermomicrobiales bacterium]|nr:hypothetical protein [Thermomicrobiales bacterium]